VGNGEILAIDEAERAFDIMTSGDATPGPDGRLLMGLKVRGETAQELAGGARALRAKMHRVKAPEGAIDIVGTGGDHHGTYNVSSCSALVVAGAGVPVAKHGNRALHLQVRRSRRAGGARHRAGAAGREARAGAGRSQRPAS